MKIAIRLVLGFFLAAGLVACAPPAASRVILMGTGNKEIPVRVELADTRERRIMGLQYRRELPADAGMLFIFPDESVHTFWMKNTPIPLDMIFINGKRRVVGVVERAVPYSTASLSVETPSRFVLEVNGGFAREHGIEAGAEVRFEGVTVTRGED